jgi:hypothetical protein
MCEFRYYCKFNKSEKKTKVKDRLSQSHLDVVDDVVFVLLLRKMMESEN